MKKIMKQILAAILVTILLSQTCVIIYAKAEEDDDIDILILTKLGFVDDIYGPKSGDELVTRGQFASMLAYLRGFDGSYGYSSKRFIDIPEDYWCAGQIYALYDNGIIHGTSKDMFSPNKYVTYPQVIKCLVTLLGYEILAEQTGGYPDGYLKTASQIGLPGGTSDTVNFKTAAKLITKAMDIELMDLQTVGDENVYGKEKNKTPLTEYNDIYHDTGIITDNGITSLTGDSRVGRGMAIVNNTLVATGDSGVEKYLGYRVKYFYKDNDGDFDLLFVIPYKTNTVELKDDKIDIDNSDFSTKKICYEVDGISKYYKIDDYADVIYNGKAYPAFDVNTLKTTQGVLTLVDNDNDGNYEVIFLDEYYTVYVSGVDTTRQIIYGKFGNEVEYGKFDVAEFYTSDGSPATVNSVNTKMVLSVFESYDDAFVKIVITAGGLSGKVESTIDGITKPDNMTAAELESFKKNARDMKMLVEGEELSFSKEYIDAVAEGYQGACIPEIGLTYVFHRDMNGKIAGIEDPTGKQYAYFITAAFIRREEIIKAKLFMEDSAILTTVFAKNVTVNGINYNGQIDGAGGILTCPEFYDEDGNFLKQPIRVRLNNLGEIIEVETPSILSNSYGYDKTKFTQCFKANQSYGGSSQRRFDKYVLANDIIIFNVPPAADFDENKLSVIPASSLNEGTTYPVTLYDSDASWSCKFAVIQAGESNDWVIAPCIVESIKKMYLDDEIANVITGLESTSWVTYIEDSPGVFPEELAPGDIVRVVRGVNNRVIRVQILVSATRNTEPFFDSLDGEDWSSYFGQLYARSDTSFTLTMNGGISIEGMPFNDTPINVYDVKTKKARRGNRNDMVMNCPIKEDGSIDLSNCNSMIYVHKRRGYARNIVVINY